MTILGGYAWSLTIALVYASGRVVVAMACVVVLVWLGLGRGSPRRTWNYLTPVVAAFDLLAKRCLAAITVAVIVVTTTRGMPDGATLWPAEGSLEQRWGERIFGTLSVLFVAETLWSAGYPPSLELSTRIHNIQAFRMMAVILSLGPLVWPGYYLTGMLLSSAVYVGFALHYGRRLAISNYRGSDAVTPLPLTTPTVDADLVFVQVTDLHLTATSAGTRVEPGVPGNSRLATLGTRLTGRRLRWLFVTGDLVDHGRPDEWSEAVKLLEQVRKAAPGVHIILVPGNHDLGTAYNTGDAYGALLLARHRKLDLAEADSTYLLRYLSHAAQLEPELRTATGMRLGDFIADDAAAEAELLERLRALKTAPSTEGRAAFAARGRALYADVDDVDWDVAGTLSSFRFEDLVVPGLWLRRWFKLFPLWWYDIKQDQAVMILNSVAPDPTHIGGAWGSVGEEQVARLRARLEIVGARRTFVLCHHAPARWADEPPPSRFAFGANIDWSTTSMLTEDVARLRAALAELQGMNGREILFLCGHRHGGRAHRPRVGWWAGGILVEGASFADLDTAVVAGWEAVDGRLEIGTLSEPTRSK